MTAASWRQRHPAHVARSWARGAKAVSASLSRAVIDLRRDAAPNPLGATPRGSAALPDCLSRPVPLRSPVVTDVTAVAKPWGGPRGAASRPDPRQSRFSPRTKCPASASHRRRNHDRDC